MEKLIFVYNAFSGTHNAVLDALHKIVSPKSYACNLCKVTYGTFSENSQWKEFRQKSKVEMDFLHIDEFRKKYASKFSYKYTFPIVLWEDEAEMGIFITSEELEQVENTGALILLIEERL
ncbi:hypothetical protein SAMN05660776_1910 [Salegentibacter holothuriorum]|uniref:GTPase n=1 Tax=Salegentibacter holothuriorum TaxID=241145 RepID=A0A1T5CGA2_9FLAO|nr:GTPase [Salegentibacter holothuriorum]SKB58464.1 hypothetical protein SAMN05660776_1910 [Salegentibacter holothuriorum]